MEFEFNSVSRIVFGAGKFSQLGAMVSRMGSSALVVHNTSDAAFHSRMNESLSAAGVRNVLLHQQGEPTVQHIDDAVQVARQHGCVCVIGIGGGSAIDAAKAIAGLLTNGGSVLDYMEVVGAGQKITRPAAPWIAVPITAGTGAEATRNAVIGYPQRQFKASVRSELLLPRVALVDPELGVNVRPEITARSGMDALCQLIESYTSTGANAMTDALALKGIALAARALPRAYRDGHDLPARSDMALAALFSGITLTNAGLGAVHGFAAPLGASFPVPHGAACAVLLPQVLRANVAALAGQAASRRYAEVGRALLNQPALPDTDAIEGGIRFVEDLVRELRIPPLREFGLSSGDVPGLCELAKKASSMRYNPAKLSDETLAHILQGAI